MTVSVLILFLTVPWLGLQCDCGISWRYSLTFFKKNKLNGSHMVKWYYVFGKNGCTDFYTGVLDRVLGIWDSIACIRETSVCHKL